MVDDWSDAEQSGRTTQVLQVPEEKGEDDADAETHEPGDEQDRHVLK